MYRLPLIILTAIIMLFMTSPTHTPVSEATPAATDATAVLNDIVADFEILASVWVNAAPCADYLITEFEDSESAAVYLGAGFEPDLAHDLAAFLLTDAPGVDRMVVTPTEFIPMISAADLPHLNAKHTSPDTVVINRCYDDCYQPGDRYVYTITARSYGGHWKISGLTLEALPR